MSPCFAAVREHLKSILPPLQQAGAVDIRYGLVGYAASDSGTHNSYRHWFVGKGHLLQDLYSGQASDENYFTTDPTRFSAALDSLTAEGDEDSLMALDIAADLPFRPVSSTRRVIALFTDEPLEDGVSGSEPIKKIPELVQKLMARRIQLFVAAPYSEALAELGTVDRSEIETVDKEDGLRSVDFAKLFAQMGKSISIASLQGGPELPWQRALFGQDRFTIGKAVPFTGR
jgi:hypothetical protein